MKKYIWYFLIPIFLGLSQTASAEVYLGSGYSAVTSGRRIPLLYGGVDVGTWEFVGSATGVQNSIYYQSAYTFSAYSMRSTGSFLWGPLRTGLGFGAFYSREGYRQTTASAVETSEDFTAGPAFRVGWNFWSHAFISMECLFGLRSTLNVLGLSTQEIPQIIVGVNF